MASKIDRGKTGNNINMVAYLDVKLFYLSSVNSCSQYKEPTCNSNPENEEIYVIASTSFCGVVWGHLNCHKTDDKVLIRFRKFYLSRMHIMLISEFQHIDFVLTIFQLVYIMVVK